MFDQNIAKDCGFEEIALPARGRSPQLETALPVAVVGGGFSGTLAVINLVRAFSEVAEGGSRQALDIAWFDSGGRFRRGLPYQEQSREADNGVYLLNQPARQMSPFAAEPDRYTEWLKENYPCYGANSFTPRNVYGRFLEDLLHDELESAKAKGLRVTLREIVSAVSDIRVSESGDLDLGSGIEAATAILALGHSKREQFPLLEGKPGYVGDPLDISKLRALPLESLSEVTLVGGGPTTIDAIRGLEHLGYRGRYNMVSASLALPWPYDPDLYTRESFARYSPVHLRPEMISENATYRELGRLLRREVKEAAASGFGPGHVYFGLDLRGIVAARASDADPSGVKELVRTVSFLRGAITTPENCALLKRLHSDGRITLYKGRAAASARAGDDGEICVEVEHRSGRRPVIRTRALVNCSAFSKEPVEADKLTLLARAREPGMSDRLFVVGPPRASDLPRTWGVESFRDEILSAALDALRGALARRQSFN